jgi:hypothetical protein
MLADMGDAPRQIAVVRDYDSLVEAIRARVAELGITLGTLDHISGVQSGYSAKVLAPTRIKNLGGMSFGALLGALALQLVAVEDSAALGRVRGRLTPRKYRPKQAPPGRARALALAREWGVEGGRKRFASMTVDERTAFHSAGGKARWRAWRRQRKKAGRRAGVAGQRRVAANSSTTAAGSSSSATTRINHRMVASSVLPSSVAR